MNTKQYNMLLTSLKENHQATAGEYTFEIRQRIATIYEFAQIWKGKRTILHAGSESECLDAARDYIQMTFAVGD